jgi:DNA-binding NarL/FixJ family response regulator/DNA-binding MarR family transcriptional regulator
VSKRGEASTFVLVVEDQALARQSYCDYLSEKEVVAIGASSLSEALEAIAKYPISVVVLDSNLNGKNGFELIDLIRTIEPPNPFMQYVVISAVTNVEVVMRAMQLSVCEFLQKPFTPSEFISSVRKAASREFSLRKKAEAETAALAALKNLQLSAERAVVDLLRLNSSSKSSNFKIITQDAADEDLQKRVVQSAISSLETILDIFGNEAVSSKWHVLLIAYDAHIRNSSITAKGIAASTRLPLTTILRKLAELEDNGIIVRCEDPNDARRSFVSLSASGISKMQKYFSIVYAKFEKTKCTV